MRKGGTAVNIRYLWFASAVILVVLLAFMNKVKDIKAGYTDLHHRVNQIEYWKERLNDK